MLEKLKEQVKKLKAELSVMIVAYKNPRTPLLPKLIIGFTIGYMLSPIDLIPDFIPVLGLLDELILVPLLIKLSIRLIPPEVMMEARQEVLKNPGISTQKNWIVGTVILVIWVLAGVAMFRWMSSISFPWPSL